MSPWIRSWGTGLGLASLPLLSLSIHAALLDARLAPVALALGTGQAAGLAWLAGARLPGRLPGRRLLGRYFLGRYFLGRYFLGRYFLGRWLLALAAALLFLLVARRAARVGLMATTALTHATLYATLLAVFATSLRPGRVPVATAIADALHGPLDPEMAAYSRGVTLLWCGVFAGQLLVSALLLGLGFAALWSFFVNILDLPLVALVFAAELAWRRRRFPGAPPVAMARMLAACRAMRPRIQREVQRGVQR